MQENARRGSLEGKARRGSLEVEGKARRGSLDGTSRRGSLDRTSRRGSLDRTSRRGSLDGTSRRGSLERKARKGSVQGIPRIGSVQTRERKGSMDSTDRRRISDVVTVWKETMLSRARRETMRIERENAERAKIEENLLNNGVWTRAKYLILEKIRKDKLANAKKLSTNRQDTIRRGSVKETPKKLSVQDRARRDSIMVQKIKLMEKGKQDAPKKPTTDTHLGQQPWRETRASMLRRESVLSLLELQRQHSDEERELLESLRRKEEEDDTAIRRGSLSGRIGWRDNIWSRRRKRPREIDRPGLITPGKLNQLKLEMCRIGKITPEELQKLEAEIRLHGRLTQEQMKKLREDGIDVSEILDKIDQEGHVDHMLDQLTKEKLDKLKASGKLENLTPEQLQRLESELSISGILTPEQLDMLEGEGIDVSDILDQIDDENITRRNKSMSKFTPQKLKKLKSKGKLGKLTVQEIQRLEEELSKKGKLTPEQLDMLEAEGIDVSEILKALDDDDTERRKKVLDKLTPEKLKKLKSKGIINNLSPEQLKWLEAELSKTGKLIPEQIRKLEGEGIYVSEILDEIGDAQKQLDEDTIAEMGNMLDQLTPEKLQKLKADGLLSKLTPEQIKMIEEEIRLHGKLTPETLRKLAEDGIEISEILQHLDQAGQIDRMLDQLTPEKLRQMKEAGLLDKLTPEQLQMLEEELKTGRLTPEQFNMLEAAGIDVAEILNMAWKDNVQKLTPEKMQKLKDKGLLGNLTREQLQRLEEELRVHGKLTPELVKKLEAEGIDVSEILKQLESVESAEIDGWNNNLTDDLTPDKLKRLSDAEFLGNPTPEEQERLEVLINIEPVESKPDWNDNVFEEPTPEKYEPDDVKTKWRDDMLGQLTREMLQKMKADGLLGKLTPEQLKRLEEELRVNGKLTPEQLKMLEAEGIDVSEILKLLDENYNLPQLHGLKVVSVGIRDLLEKRKTHLSASSVKYSGLDFSVRRSIINTKAIPGEAAGGWSPEKDDRNPWIQADFQSNHAIDHIEIQGRFGVPHFVTKFHFRYKAAQDTKFHMIPNPKDGKELTIKGTDDNVAVNMYYFPEPLIARWVRIYPVEWKHEIGLRWEVFGHPVDAEGRERSDSVAAQARVRSDKIRRVKTVEAKARRRSDIDDAKSRTERANTVDAKASIRSDSAWYHYFIPCYINEGGLDSTDAKARGRSNGDDAKGRRGRTNTVGAKAKGTANTVDAKAKATEKYADAKTKWPANTVDEKSRERSDYFIPC